MTRFALAVLVVLMSVSSAGAAPAVVGGTAVTIRSAPWAVVVEERVGSNVLLCSGAVIAPARILTAAHCVADPHGGPAQPGVLSVVAGVSNFLKRERGDAPQARRVSAVRIDPGYATSHTAAYDVAVLTLAEPLVPGPVVRAAALPRAGRPFPAGVTGDIAAFGRESPGRVPDGSLNLLRLRVDARGACGSNATQAALPRYAAVAFCASSPEGAICLGDSGGVVVIAGTNTILGVAMEGPQACGAGNHAVYTWLGAHAIAAFVASTR